MRIIVLAGILLLLHSMAIALVMPPAPVITTSPSKLQNCIKLAAPSNEATKQQQQQPPPAVGRQKAYIKQVVQQQQQKPLVIPVVLSLVVAMTVALTPLQLAAFAAVNDDGVATSSTTFDPVRTFANTYADPFHPQCKRQIQVDPDGKSFTFSGTHVRDDHEGRGCSPAEQKLYGGLEPGFFRGTIDGSKISAGDGVHEGVWEPANSKHNNAQKKYGDVDGIRWDDGNKWIVSSQSKLVRQSDNTFQVASKDAITKVGELFFYAYLGGSTLAGVKGLWDAVQRKLQES